MSAVRDAALQVATAAAAECGGSIAALTQLGLEVRIFKNPQGRGFRVRVYRPVQGNVACGSREGEALGSTPEEAALVAHVNRLVRRNAEGDATALRRKVAS